MTRRNKLAKFAEILEFPNVYENFDFKDNKLTISETERIAMLGQWHTHFKNNNPITLELACGRGEYTNALAEAFPDKNFIGVDIKGARIWKGAKYALLKGLDNVAYLRTKIEFLSNFFEKGEVEEIWITFPDPFLKDGSENRRLTAPPFLERYQKVLKPGGYINLKTDDDTLYEYSVEVGKTCDLVTIDTNIADIYAEYTGIEELDYKTYYEAMHLKAGKKIKYLRYKMKS